MAAPGRPVKGPSLLQSQVTQEPFHGMNRDCAVKLGSIADRLAGVIADPTVNRGHGIVGDQLTPRLLVVPSFDAGEPCLYVLASRAARIARRHQVDVSRSATAYRSGAGWWVQQIRQRREVSRDHCRAGDRPPCPPGAPSAAIGPAADSLGRLPGSATSTRPPTGELCITQIIVRTVFSASLAPGASGRRDRRDKHPPTLVWGRTSCESNTPRLVHSAFDRYGMVAAAATPDRMTSTEPRRAHPRAPL